MAYFRLLNVLGSVAYVLPVTTTQKLKSVGVKSGEFGGWSIGTRLLITILPGTRVMRKSFFLLEMDLIKIVTLPL
jgi:hypothetical protein